MAEQLGLGKSNATTYMSFFIAACYFLPLVGGFLADNFFGQYRTTCPAMYGIENQTMVRYLPKKLSARKPPTKGKK